MMHLNKSLITTRSYIDSIRTKLFSLINSLYENNERTRKIMLNIHQRIKSMAQNNNFDGHDFKDIVSLCKNETNLSIKNRKEFKDCWLKSSYVVLADYALKEKALLITNYYKTIRRISSINDINTHLKMLQNFYERIIAKMQYVDTHVVPGLKNHALKLESNNIESLNKIEKQLAYNHAA